MLGENSDHVFDRLGEQKKEVSLLGVRIPLFEIPVTFGRNIGELIETSVIKFKFEINHKSAIQIVNQRIKDYMEPD